VAERTFGRARRLRTLVGGLLGAALLAGCGSAEGTGELSVEPLRTPWAVDGTSLVRSDGTPFSLVEDTDKPLTIVFYGYTNCPDICGQVMQTLALTMTRLDAEQREEVDVVFVTTDPARDTAEVVGEYVSRYDESFIGVTGELDDIITVADSMHVGVEQGEKLPSGGYDITHGTQVFAVDDSDAATLFWSESVSQTTLASDISTLLSED
jgi:protein SCO1/2